MTLKQIIWTNLLLLEFNPASLNIKSTKPELIFKEFYHSLDSAQKSMETIFSFLLKLYDPSVTILIGKEFKTQIYKYLEVLKKEGKINGILRKTFFDECKGERYERILFEFSCLVLKKFCGFNKELGLNEVKKKIDEEGRKFMSLLEKRAEFRRKVKEIDENLVKNAEKLAEKKKLLCEKIKIVPETKDFNFVKEKSLEISDAFFTRLEELISFSEKFNSAVINLREEKSLQLSYKEPLNETKIIPETFYSSWQRWTTKENIVLFSEGKLDLGKLMELLYLSLSYVALFYECKVDQSVAEFVKLEVGSEVFSFDGKNVLDFCKDGLKPFCDKTQVENMLEKLESFSNEYKEVLKMLYEKIESLEPLKVETGERLKVISPFRLPQLDIKTATQPPPSSKQEPKDSPLQSSQIDSAKSVIQMTPKQKLSVKRNPKDILARDLAKLAVSDPLKENYIDLNVYTESQSVAFLKRNELPRTPPRFLAMEGEEDLFNEEAPF